MSRRSISFLFAGLIGVGIASSVFYYSTLEKHPDNGNSSNYKSQLGTTREVSFETKSLADIGIKIAIPKEWTNKGSKFINPTTQSRTWSESILVRKEENSANKNMEEVSSFIIKGLGYLSKIRDDIPDTNIVLSEKTTVNGREAILVRSEGYIKDDLIIIEDYLFVDNGSEFVYITYQRNPNDIPINFMAVVDSVQFLDSN